MIQGTSERLDGILIDRLMLRRYVLVSVSSVLIVLSLVGCSKRQANGPTVTSFLAGQVVLRDSTIESDDNSGFRVYALARGPEGVDTLGIGVTDADGRFATALRSREEGVYPLYVRRAGGVLKEGQIVVAEGDSATVSITIPGGSRPLLVRSPQNGAWMAYQNVKQTYNRSLSDLIQRGAATDENIRQTVLQSSSLMWDVQRIYPRTLGAKLGAVESLMMLGSLTSPSTDSLIVERIAEIESTNPAFVEAGRVGWRALARLENLETAVALLDSMRLSTGIAEQKAALQSEIVLAYQDSLRYDEARHAANVILASYNDTDWADWARSAIYELDNLRPGQPAPAFRVATRDGRQVSLETIQTPWVLLEFYEPRNEVYQRELSIREAFLASPSADDVTVISMSVEPDDDVNEAFLERGLGGYHVTLANGLEDEIAVRYNVKLLPKRILIRDGVIVAKYSGTAMLDIIADVVGQPSS
ncbi:MAG: redoxin domain-containing protein [Rhodothermales bacterium]